MNESTKMVVVLVIVSLLSAISLSIVYEKTEPIIKEKKSEELRNSLKGVMPAADRFEENNELKEIISEEREGIKKIFNAYDEDNKKMGMVLLMDGLGFNAVIRILVGIDIDSKKITGIKILEHLETPGLGERITEDEFLSQFFDKSIMLQANEIDAITGATISSTAVIDVITLNVNRISEYIIREESEKIEGESGEEELEEIGEVEAAEEPKDELAEEPVEELLVINESLENETIENAST